MPQRVVSANLCTDRLVMQLLGRDHVVAVSPFAADPKVSTVAEEARGLPTTEGSVEDMVAFHPDLVLLGAYNAPTTGAMLEALGIPVFILPTAESLDEVRSAIAAMAAALGVPERGAAMIAELDARLARLPRHDRPVRAAVFQAGGWSAGSHTLADDLFQRIGFTNIAAKAGVRGFGTLPLETLIAAGPELIVVEQMGEAAPSVSSELLAHPALAASGARRVLVPMRLWACPDPTLVEAADLIAGGAP